MQKKNVRLLLMLVMAAVMISISGCKKEKKTVEPDPVDPDPTEEVVASDIDKFIWNDMNLYYLWYKDVPDLADNRFANTQDFYTYLNTFNNDHSALFEDLLYQRDVVDKWSWIVDDYVELENSFQGISLSMGMEYGLYKYSNSDGVYGIIEYVVEDAPADLGGIKRGEIFTAIDGQDLDVSNYSSLLFDRDAFTISFASINNNTISPNGKTVSLTAVEVHENPIHYTDIIETGGRKVGYMVYNAFRSNYDNELNTAFGEFKNAGIQDLILDFRYNGGGSVQTATYLGSMIYDNDPDKLFAITQYNDKLELEFRDYYGADYFNTMFEAGIAQEFGADIPINTLNLNRVYIITTGGSASASELVINGLDPYIDVITVGEATHGKYVGSFTIKDSEWDGSKWVVNPSHTWALQPITLKIANSLGVSDFVNGFAPDYEVEEDIYNMLPFGDEDEQMLKAALNAINGIPQTKSLSSHQFEKIADSKDFKPHAKEMFINEELIRPDKLKKK